MPQQAEKRSEVRSTMFSAKKLTGLRVYEGEKNKQLGKVRCFVFHPSKKRCVGFLVKRPDAALMFRRKDSFVAFDGFELHEDGVRIKDGDAFTGSDACKRLDVDLDRCVIWQGMPVVSEGGESIGFVDDVLFSSSSGAVDGIVPQSGATAKVLLGTVSVPRDLILGFKLGVGELLNVTGEEDGEECDLHGAIVVSDKVLSLDAEGGFAEKAGKTAAIAAENAKRVKDAAKPKVSAAGDAAGKAIGKGAFATGRQLSRAKGMFAAFKSEYEKAVADDSKQTKR